MQYQPPKIPNSVSPTQRQFLRAYAELPGYIASAAQRAGTPRRTVYNWLKTDRNFRRAFRNIKCTADDFVMSKLFERIEKEDSRAIIFYLKTYGKSRGYA